MDIGLDSSGVAGVPGSIPGPAVCFQCMCYMLIGGGGGFFVYGEQRLSCTQYLNYMT